MRMDDPFYQFDRRLGGGSMTPADGITLTTADIAAPAPPSEEAPATAVVDHPFRLSIVGSDIKISAGRVNGILPTGWDEVDGAVFSVSTTTYFWLKCEGTYGATPESNGYYTSSYSVTSQTSSSPATPSGSILTPTSFVSFRMIGSVTFVSGTPVAGNNIVSNQGVEGYVSIVVWSPV